MRIKNKMTPFDHHSPSHPNINLLEHISIEEFFINFEEEDHIDGFTITNNNEPNSSSLDTLDDLNISEIEEVIEWLAIDDQEQADSINNYTSLILPTQDIELDPQLVLNHLVTAYIEAMETQNTELVNVIVSRINEKVSPIGDVQQRILYHMFHEMDKELNGYVESESKKVFRLAFDAVYRVLINGMFAHFGANSAILEALPSDVDVVHVVDFDVGVGIQWSSLIVCVSQMENVLLKITFIKWDDEEEDEVSLSTKKMIKEFGDSYGLNVEVEEIEMEDLVVIKRGYKEFLCFNLMWGLPHMRKRRNVKKVAKFLNLARPVEIVEDASGIIIYGEGECFYKMINDDSCFESFFESVIKYYEILVEMIELGFLNLEARLVIESLFMAPFVKNEGLVDLWREMRGFENGDFGPIRLKFGLGLKVSDERLMEAQVMVREGESLYSVKVEGENSNFNEMVLEWRETPLVRISTWKL